MVLDPIPQSLPVHFFGSRPQPPTSHKETDQQERGRVRFNCVYMYACAQDGQRERERERERKRETERERERERELQQERELERGEKEVVNRQRKKALE